MTDSRSDARRIVTQCLIEAVRGPDEAKAAAARAEILYRRNKAIDTLRLAVQKMFEGMKPAIEAFKRLSAMMSEAYEEEQDGELRGISAGGPYQDGRGSG